MVLENQNIFSDYKKASTTINSIISELANVKLFPSESNMSFPNSWILSS